MQLFHEKNETIPNGNYRIIKVGKEALFEFIYESIIDNQEEFFDISDGTSIVTHFDIDWERGELICVARNVSDKNEHWEADVDTKKLLLKLKDTTNTLYTDGRYIELTQKQVDEITH